MYGLSHHAKCKLEEHLVQGKNKFLNTISKRHSLKLEFLFDETLVILGL